MVFDVFVQNLQTFGLGSGSIHGLHLPKIPQLDLSGCGEDLGWVSPDHYTKNVLQF